MYAAVARTRSLCLCVFEAGLEHLRVDGEPVTVISLRRHRAGCAPEPSP